MMMKKTINTYFHTLKYLRIKQFYFRIYYFFRLKIRSLLKHTYPLQIDAKSSKVTLFASIPFPKLFSDGSFCFIGISHRFENGMIDWNCLDHGKLWTYNLNYFEFLQQEDMHTQEGIALIDDFISKIEKSKIGMMPFPISLRGINWIKFLSKNDINDKRINDSLYAQYYVLLDNIEYHILGNHLLENGFSLLFGAYYFRDEKFYEKAYEILTEELDEQVLNDGGHFELSPMYHQIMLFRVLDALNLVSNNKWHNDTLLDILKEKASVMLGWLQEMTFSDGTIPLLNDSAYGIAPTTAELLSYASRLGIQAKKIKLDQSGYRKILTDAYECLIDVGNIGPDYIPGHAHSDTFNFLLHVKGEPVIVDTGISTYENNATRQYERSTAAHNTVVINGEDQSHVWGAFRVAERAKIVTLHEDQKHISATHDGYRSQGMMHTRRWEFDQKSIFIEDKIDGGHFLSAVSYLHLYPGTPVRIEGSSIVTPNVRITYDDAETLEIGEYAYAAAFNQTKTAPLIRAKIGRKSTMEVEII